MQEKHLANLIEIQKNKNKEAFIASQSSNIQTVSEQVDQIVPKMRFKLNKSKTRSTSRNLDKSVNGSVESKTDTQSIIKKKTVKKKRVTKPTEQINTTYDKIQEAKKQLEQVFIREKQKESTKIQELEQKIEILTKARNLEVKNDYQIKYEELLYKKQQLQKRIDHFDKAEQDQDVKFTSEMNQNSPLSTIKTTRLHSLNDEIFDKKTISCNYVEPIIEVNEISSSKHTNKSVKKNFRCPKPPIATEILSQDVFLFKLDTENSPENTKKLEQKKIHDTEKLALNRKLYFDEIIKAEEEKLKRTRADLQKERELIKDLSRKKEIPKETIKKINNDLETGRLKKEAEAQKHEVLIKKLEEKRRAIDQDIEKESILKKRFVEKPETEYQPKHKDIKDLNQKHQVIYEQNLKKYNELKLQEINLHKYNDSLDVQKVKKLKNEMKTEEGKLENTHQHKKHIIDLSFNGKNRPKIYIEDYNNVVVEQQKAAKNYKTQKSKSNEKTEKRFQEDYDRLQKKSQKLEKEKLALEKKQEHKTESELIEEAKNNKKPTENKERLNKIDKQLASMKAQYKQEKAKIDEEKLSEENKLIEVRQQLKKEEVELENLRKQKLLEADKIKEELYDLMKQKTEFETQFNKDLIEKDKMLEAEKLRILNELEMLDENDETTVKTSDEENSLKMETTGSSNQKPNLSIHNDDILIEESTTKSSYKVDISNFKQILSPTKLNKEIDSNLHSQHYKSYNTKKSISRHDLPMKSVAEQMYDDDDSYHNFLIETKSSKIDIDQKTVEIRSEAYKIKVSEKRKQSLESFKKQKLQEAFYDKVFAEYIIDRNVIESKRKFQSGGDKYKTVKNNHIGQNNNIFSNKNTPRNDQIYNTEPTNNKNAALNSQRSNSSYNRRKEALPLIKHSKDRKSFNIKIMNKNSADSVFEQLKSTLDNHNKAPSTKDLYQPAPQIFETLEDEKTTSNLTMKPNYKELQTEDQLTKKSPRFSNIKNINQINQDKIFEVPTNTKDSVDTYIEPTDQKEYNLILDKNIDNFFNNDSKYIMQKRPASPNIGNTPILSYKDKYKNNQHNTVSGYSQQRNYKNKERVDLLKNKIADITDDNIEKQNYQKENNKHLERYKNLNSQEGGRLLFHDRFPQGEQIESDIDYRLINKIMKEYEQNKVGLDNLF